MGSSFNAQILVEKLAKLNNSQASIETLSHWCIFHMNKAKYVVETWDKQFHCSPREQRLAYLYLANDILQNSRRKGSEFVGEFWKVLPDALRDVIANNDGFGRNAALRLINIWDERKVFGSRGHILKEEFSGKQPENVDRNGKHVPVKLRHENGSTLEKVVSAVEALYGGQIDEDVIIGKCSNTTNYLVKVGKEVEEDLSSGHPVGPAVVKEMQGQHGVLRDCIEQLRAIETSRTNLVSHLRDSLHEQEMKLEKIRNQIQVSRSQSDRMGDLCRQLVDHGGSQPIVEDESKEEAIASTAQHSFRHSDVEQSAPVMFANLSQPEENPRKSAAAAVAAKLTASTSSVQMFSYVLSSLASEGVIGNHTVTEPSSSSGDFPPEKRPKLQSHEQSYSSGPPLPPPPPPAFQLNPQFLQPLQPPGPINNMPFSYSMSAPVATATQQQASSVPGYIPENSQQKYIQGTEGLYNMNSSSATMTPVTRQ